MVLTYITMHVEDRFTAFFILVGIKIRKLSMKLVNDFNGVLIRKNYNLFG